MSDPAKPTPAFPSPLPPRSAATAASPAAVTQAMKRVRQTRDFLPTAVPEEVITDILDVARWTGSAGNRQPWTFVVIKDPAVKARMAEVAPYTAHIGIAPVVIAVILDPQRPETDHFEEARLTERMMIAATAHGLACGLARIRPDGQDVVRELLGVPPELVARSMVSIGYPTEAARLPKSVPGAARKPLAEIVRRERFA